MTELLQRILPTVQKPARYTGGEFNEIKKNLLLHISSYNIAYFW